MKCFSIFIFLLLTVFISCSKKKDEPKAVVSNCPDSSGTISYSSQIVPIINASCGKTEGSCHSSSSSFGDFNTYQGFTSHPSDHIIHCIRQDNSSYLPMPYGGSKLSACNIAKIVNWINQGKKNN